MGGTGVLQKLLPPGGRGGAILREWYQSNVGFDARSDKPSRAGCSACGRYTRPATSPHSAGFPPALKYRGVDFSFLFPFHVAVNGHRACSHVFGISYATILKT